MKKILATALALTLTFGAFSLPVIENDFGVADKFSIAASAEQYGDFWYDVLDDGTAEITGYNQSSSTVTIPSTINGKKVTRIGDEALSDYLNITNVIIPNGVTSIGSKAFSGCYNLKNVTIPSSVTSIGSKAFMACFSLKNITVDSNNKNYVIKDGVLFNKKQTNLICCPAGSKGTYTIPSTVTSIEEDAFGGCYKITSIIIPSSIKSIGDCAFEACGITSVTIPNSVTSIGKDAFSGCSDLASVTIPSSVTSIGDGAFGGCSGLTSITIPKSVKSIGNGTFYGCDKLTSITIPDGVKSIGDSAFEFCSSLTSITIPSSVTSIGDSVFEYCKKLTNITIPNSVTSIGDYAFRYCESLTRITIPNSVTSIGYDAFSNCSKLIDINIPSSVTSIAYGTFSWCANLKSVTIPSSVTSIEEDAFYGCNNLNDVYYNGTKSEWENIEISNLYNDPLTNATIHYNSTGDNYTQKEISSCTISLPTATQYFRGTRIRPVVTIKDGTKVLKSGTDYTVSYTNNLSVGKATVTITGKGDYTGTVTKNFNIVQRSIGNCDVELGAANYYFNGTRIKPSVKVYCNGTEMYNGNYTVAYSNNLSAGTATITLTGKKNLKGTVTKTFKINPRNIANCTISLTKNSANKYQPNVAVKIGSNTIYNGNYTVKYTTSADKKTVKVTITGKGNLAGTTTKTYTV